MEGFQLQYDKRFILNISQRTIPDECSNLPRTQTMLHVFENVLKQEEWHHDKIYVLLMLIYSFEDVKEHVIAYENQPQKWIRFIGIHLDRIATEHMDFKLSVSEFVRVSLDMFFIL